VLHWPRVPSCLFLSLSASTRSATRSTPSLVALLLLSMCALLASLVPSLLASLSFHHVFVFFLLLSGTEEDEHIKETRLFEPDTDIVLAYLQVRDGLDARVRRACSV